MRGAFKSFVEQSMGDEEQKDILATLQKLPSSHSALVKGFRWKLQGGNTLQGDDQHVGYMDDGEREIAVAAPWRYSREMCALHEVAHRVWEHLPPGLRQQWLQIVAQTKDRPNQQEPEELFAMAYASAYAKHPPITYYKPEWIKFIKNLPA